MGVSTSSDTGNWATGRHGEQLVASWYRRRGWHVVAHSWRCRAGEVDLVLLRRGVMVFCEVKTRRSGAFGAAAEAVDHRKQARLERLAAVFLSRWDAPAPRFVRFDVAVVERQRVKVFEGAWG